MNKFIYAAIITIVILFFQTSFMKADWNFDPKLKINSDKNYSAEKLKKDYNDAMKYHKKITGSFLGASIDFMIGYGSTSANVEQNVNSKTISTTSQGGMTLGALVNLNLFGLLDLTTGLDFINKKFNYGIPYTSPEATGDSITNSLKNNYLNIPLNINYSGKLSDKVGISFSGGPYFGILLNPENAVSGFKDFDLGLNGLLTGRYFLNQFVSILLGGSVQYGGLNNLLDAGSVDKLHTTNWGIFTGMGFGF